MLGNADARGAAGSVGRIVGSTLIPTVGCMVGEEDRTEVAVVVWIVGAIVGIILCVSVGSDEESAPVPVPVGTRLGAAVVIVGMALGATEGNEVKDAGEDGVVCSVVGGVPMVVCNVVGNTVCSILGGTAVGAVGMSTVGTALGW